MARSKVVPSLAEAVADIPDGATLFCGGFGGSGYPEHLVRALADRRIRGLTVISNNAGHGPLFAYGGIRRLICSYPVGPTSRPYLEPLERGEVPLELELEAQGTLAERIHAGGAGLGGVLTPVGVDTGFAGGKPVMEVDGHRYLLAGPLRADFALLKADRADPWGNLVYRHAARNFNALMALAARVVIAEVREVVPLGELDPDVIHTPGPFVDRVVVVPQHARPAGPGVAGRAGDGGSARD